MWINCASNRVCRLRGHPSPFITDTARRFTTFTSETAAKELRSGVFLSIVLIKRTARSHWSTIAKIIKSKWMSISSRSAVSGFTKHWFQTGLRGSLDPLEHTGGCPSFAPKPPGSARFGHQPPFPEALRSKSGPESCVADRNTTIRSWSLLEVKSIHLRLLATTKRSQAGKQRSRFTQILGIDMKCSTIESGLNSSECRQQYYIRLPPLVRNKAKVEWKWNGRHYHNRRNRHVTAAPIAMPTEGQGRWESPAIPIERRFVAFDSLRYLPGHQSWGRKRNRQCLRRRRSSRGSTKSSNTLDSTSSLYPKSGNAASRWIVNRGRVPRLSAGVIANARPWRFAFQFRLNSRCS